MIKAVLFDLDGTLIDSIDVIVELLDDVLHELKINADANKARHLIGMSPWDIIQEVTGLKTFEEQDKVIQLWAKKYISALFAENKVHLTKGAIEVLAALKNKGLKIGIASSLKSSIIGDLLPHYNLSPYISAYAGVDEVKNPKPAPDVFILAAQKLGVDPKETLVVGDAPYDILGGRAIGAITVLFRPNSVSDNLKATPDYVITELKQLLGIVSKHTTQN